MSADLTGSARWGTGWKFLETSASVVVVRLDPAGTILAANSRAVSLIGRPLVGQPWHAMLLNLAGKVPLADWLADPARPRLLNVQTASGPPQSLQVTVEPDGPDYLLFGEINAAELDLMSRELLDLNQELSDLSRELGHKNSDLAEVLREKESLLKETHHRVKNNLALIVSLMRLTARSSLEVETKTVLKEMQARIQSVILLNETLYRTESYTRVKLADYLKQIATHLFSANNASTGAVRLVLELDPVEVETGQAIPCGLIVNELMTNSLKYAFSGGLDGEVRVGLRRQADGSVRLSVSDTGAGLPEDFNSKPRTSLGLQLVGDLAGQLQGTLVVGPGATFTITFEPRTGQA